MKESNSEKIMGEIVLFNPDIARLQENIASILPQVEELYIYDNGSDNIMDIEACTDAFNELRKKIYLYKDRENKGIARALNSGMEYAKENGYRWVLSLDQDSIFPCEGIEKYFLSLKDNKEVAIVTPKVYDRNLKVELGEVNEDEYIKEAITSGALVRTDVWEQVGGYDEWLFIDGVDHEFSWRVIEHGYKIMRVNGVELVHELGNSKFHQIGKYKFIVYNYSAFRKYYQVRNQLFLKYKYQKHCTIFDVLKKQTYYILTVMIYEENKIKKVRAIIKGGIDAYKKIHM